MTYNVLKAKRDVKEEDIEVCGGIRDGSEPLDLAVPVVTNLEGYGNLPSLSEIDSLRKADKRKVLLSALTPSLQPHEEIDSFPLDVRLAILSTIHWMNSTETRISEFHVHALPHRMDLRKCCHAEENLKTTSSPDALPRENQFGRGRNREDEDQRER